ncbi:hypothetical protein BASA81_006599 [Batrachochytrium salamandrivorans]|nr:hypothetical protein BASA81_010620 [Batrachochytrium salamandrivorans]KAH9255471.1 hypothetical protein BASA81_006590 [Batrachochytrium salamandrivorans]KAH9255480.1 hypothetical protein BASA81_006599 [Batrachochytrium salamandrivorans]
MADQEQQLVWGAARLQRVPSPVYAFTLILLASTWVTLWSLGIYLFAPLTCILASQIQRAAKTPQQFVSSYAYQTRSRIQIQLFLLRILVLANGVLTIIQRQGYISGVSCDSLSMCQVAFSLGFVSIAGHIGLLVSMSILMAAFASVCQLTANAAAATATGGGNGGVAMAVVVVGQQSSNVPVAVAVAVDPPPPAASSSPPARHPTYAESMHQDVKEGRDFV